MLRTLVASQPSIDSRGRPIKRKIQTHRGDFNITVDAVLNAGIDAKEATFCLLDQRTFECDWNTVVKLAMYKPPGSNKIELFYFLAVGWLHRSLSGIKGDRAEKWWGRKDWAKLRAMSHDQIVNAFIERFEIELGYKWVKAFPIYAREEGGHVLYHMIHASDHDEAPGLMFRAYNRTVRRSSPSLQRPMDLDLAPAIEIT